MIENNIRALRLKRNLTQRKLAELAGTSQQQVQRIEAGLQSPKVDLAQKLSSALHASMREMFPSASAVELPEQMLPRDKAAVELAKAGIDIDPCIYTFRVRMRGGLEKDFEIGSVERERLASILRDRSKHYFAVFDTASERIALNLKELSFCQFLFDVGIVSSAEAQDHANELEPLKFWLTNSAEPLTFDVDYDPVDADDEEAGNISDIFYYLEMYDGDDEVSFLNQVSFIDADGERAIFLNSHIAACSIPLEFIFSAYRKSQAEGDEEDLVDQVNA